MALSVGFIRPDGRSDRPVMADRGQEVAAAWPPRALLVLTAPRAGRREVERALLPSARALPLQFSSFASTACSDRAQRPPLLPSELRLRLASSPHHLCPLITAIAPPPLPLRSPPLHARVALFGEPHFAMRSSGRPA